MLWTKEGKWIADLPHASYVWSTTFSPNDDTILTSSWDQKTKVWDIKGDFKFSISNQARTWFSYFSEDNSKIFTISKDRAGLKVYDIEGNPISSMEVGIGINKLVFSKKHGSLITSTTNHIKFWDTSYYKENLKGGKWFWLDNQLLNINGNKLTLNKTQLINHSFNKTIKRIFKDNDQLIVITSTNHSSAESRIKNNQNTATIKDTTMIYSFDKNNNVSFRDYIGFDVKSVEFNHSSKEILVVSNNGEARLIDKNGSITSTLKLNVPFNESIDEITTALFSKSGDTILTFSAVGYLSLWNKSGQELKKMDFSISKDDLPSKNGYSKKYGTFDFSSSENKIVTFPGESFVYVYDLKTKKTDTLYYNKEGDIHSLIRTGRLINNGKYLITMNNFGIDIWNTKDGQKLAHIDCKPLGFDISEDEKRIIVNTKNEGSFIFLLPKGIKNWVRTINIAPLSKENKIKYDL